jgi:tetratricopeptide (TPR) repeat protein
MQEPNSPEEVFALHKLRRADPQRFLEIVDEWLRANPRNSRAYFSRHFVWADMGEPRRALADLDRVIELAPTQAAFCARGAVNRDLGDYENALADFHRGEAMNPKEWEDAAITLLYEADTHADWATRPPRYPAAPVCRMIFGLPASTALPVAAKRKLPTCCVA